MQAVKSRNNKDMSPATAKRRRQAMARTTEGMIFLLNAANTSAALAVPCIVVAKTPTADPLPAAALTMTVRCLLCTVNSRPVGMLRSACSRHQQFPRPGAHQMLCMLQTVILWMKLVSFAHCNSDFR